jgi:hypothetical protein
VNDGAVFLIGVDQHGVGDDNGARRRPHVEPVREDRFLLTSQARDSEKYGLLHFVTLALTLGGGSAVE